MEDYLDATTKAVFLFSASILGLFIIGAILFSVWFSQDKSFRMNFDY